MVSQETPASGKRLAMARRNRDCPRPEEKTGVGWPAVLPRAFAPGQGRAAAAAAAAAATTASAAPTAGIPLRTCDECVCGLRKGYCS